MFVTFQIHEAAFHMARILLDIEAGSPIILVPHSSKTTDVLVADLGTLSVKNCFKFDGDPETFSHTKSEELDRADGARTSLFRTDSQISQKSDSAASRSSSQSFGGVRARTVSQGLDSVVQTELPLPLTQSIFDELQPPRSNVDLMTESIYGSLERDIRNEDINSEIDEIYDLTVKNGSSLPPDGASVDPVSPRSSSRSSRQNLLLDTSFDRTTSRLLHPPSSPALLRSCSSTSEASTRDRNVFSNNKESPSEAPSVTIDMTQHKCLLDILEVKLSDMDLFSAERVDKKLYKKKNKKQDLEFPSSIIQRRIRFFLKIILITVNSEIFA